VLPPPGVASHAAAPGAPSSLMGHLGVARLGLYLHTNIRVVAMTVVVACHRGGALWTMVVAGATVERTNQQRRSVVAEPNG
jgi:hypothetical protein